MSLRICQALAHSGGTKGTATSNSREPRSPHPPDTGDRQAFSLSCSLGGVTSPRGAPFHSWPDCFSWPTWPGGGWCLSPGARWEAELAEGVMGQRMELRDVQGCWEVTSTGRMGGDLDSTIWILSCRCRHSIPEWLWDAHVVRQGGRALPI